MEIGEISPSMGVNTKPAKDLNIGGYWLKVDPNMPEWMFEKLKMAIEIHSVQFKKNMTTTFFRVLCNQNHIHMGFGYNSESIEELAQSYLTYKSINWDSEETEAHYRSLPCKDVIALMLDDEFEIEQSNAPFEELE